MDVRKLAEQAGFEVTTWGGDERTTEILGSFDDLARACALVRNEALEEARKVYRAAQRLT